MRLTKLSKYRELVYAPGSAPSLATLRNRIKEIPGGTILHGHYYVDLDKLDLHTAAVAKEHELAANPLLADLV